MKYSVLMSVYKNDNPDFLKLALESIYEKQTKKPDEIVIVFDGPITEELLNVLESFRSGKEEIVKFYPQPKNKGLGEALRVGSRFCTGDYIFRMDSDDISTDDRFEVQSRYIEEHPNIDVLGGSIAEFNKNPNEKNLRKRVCHKNHEDIVKMGRRRNPMNHVTVCIKKLALEKSGGYLPLKYVEDYYLWLRMIDSGCKLANVDDVLVYVRIGNGFNSRRGQQEQVESWKVIQEFMTDKNMITKREAKKNMFFIKAFVNTPKWLKTLIYSMFLRR